MKGAVFKAPMAISPLQTASALPAVPTTQENEGGKPPAMETTE